MKTARSLLVARAARPRAAVRHRPPRPRRRAAAPRRPATAAERPAHHHRHPARGPPRRLRLSPADRARASTPWPRSGAVFEQAYTFWPKTRGSFVMMMTGRRPSQNGYSKTHPMLVDFNPTLASVLEGARATRRRRLVDNPNVAAALRLREGLRPLPRDLEGEGARARRWTRTRAITEEAAAFLRDRRSAAPFFLWLHYVNPHAPYTPPPPYDTTFMDARPTTGRGRCPSVAGFHGGVPKQWAVPGRTASATTSRSTTARSPPSTRRSAQVSDALASAGPPGRTVVVLTSDHGESLGEHDYFFDHGEDSSIPACASRSSWPCRARPRACAAARWPPRSTSCPRCSTSVKVSYPARSRRGAACCRRRRGRPSGPATRLFAQNERNLTATWDERYRLVATPGGCGGERWPSTIARRIRGRPATSRARSPEALRAAPPRAGAVPGAGRPGVGADTRRMLEGKAGELPMSDEAREKLSRARLHQVRELRGTMARVIRRGRHRARHAVHAGRGSRRGRAPHAGAAPGRGADRRARAVRHHRRERDHDRRRAEARGGDHGGGGEGPRPVLAGAGSNDTRVAVDEDEA